MTAGSVGRNSGKTRVLIVDDHPLVRHGLMQLINAENDMEVFAQAGGAAETLEIIGKTPPDVAILDLSLQEGSGLELIRQIRNCDESIRILVSSMHDESLYAERAIHAGALGYINKQEAMDRIIDAIRQVLRGKVYLSERMKDRMLLGLTGPHAEEGNSPIKTLSNREIEVFERIGRGESTRKIADQFHLSVKTVETYRENIKRKLNLETNLELIRHAVEWVLEQDRGEAPPP